MNPHVVSLWVAGAVQMAIILANVVLPARLRVRSGMASVPRFLRQVFIVHWAYIIFVVFLFSLLCFLFPAELAGGSALGRFLSGAMALFWLARLLLQLFYYDRQTRRENRGLDLAYLAGLVVLIGIFGVGATGHLA
ncbi:MAG: hypothetical protein LAN64_05485 [Acidobacteriia bacterium]|nr:hypothetical protein [Terriglobia bacterium]